MKNKLLFLIVFLFYNLANNIFADEFILDVKKIDISENGNIIKGSN